MKLRKLLSSLTILGISLAVPAVSFAGALISEIMYDLPGTDTGREWVEVQNTGSGDVSFSKWKLFEANTNHGLTLFQGNATTSANGFMIIADDPAKFLADNPHYNGTLFGSSFSLSNIGETLELKVDNGSVYQTTYASTSGAGGDGNSLHFSSNAWQAGVPTPGNETAQTPPPSGPNASSSAETAETSSPDATPQTSASPPANYGATTFVYKPQMYVSAFVPQKGVAGAPVLFDAVAVGVKKEPIQSARYVWSFGDGATTEGKKIYHTYHYPAVYVVMVDASSGEWSATDRKEITIAAPELFISNIKEGETGFIEVQNDGKNEVDLSLWRLKSEAGMFTIPQGTVIGARKAIPFPAAITGLSADRLSTALLYPNGNLVVGYAPKRETPEPLPVKAEESKIIAAVAEKTRPEKPTPEPAKEPVKKESPKNSEDAISGQAPKSNEESISGLAPREQSDFAGQATSSAASTELLGAVGATSESSTIPWILGVTLLVAVSTLGYMAMLRPKPEPSAAETLRKAAAEYDLME